MKRRIINFCAVIMIFTVFVGLAAGQTNNYLEIVEIKPGQNLPRINGITPRSEQFISFMMKEGKRTVSSLLTRTIRVSKIEDRQTIDIEQRYDTANDLSVDTSAVDGKTMFPISYRSQIGKMSESFEFSQNQIQGTISAGESADKVKPFNLKLASPVFNAVVINELIQALPLKQGYRASFPMHNPGKQSFKFVLTVSNAEKIQTANGKYIDVWVIEIEGGAAPSTWWIDKQTQTLIRKKVTLNNGAEFWQVRLY